MSYFRVELNSLLSIIHALTAVNKSKLLDEDGKMERLTFRLQPIKFKRGICNVSHPIFI